MQELVEDCAGEMQQSLKGHLLTVRGENALNIELSTAEQRKKVHTLASLSAARCAYMLGCSDTLSMLLACGNAERPLDRLGSATRLCLSAGMPRELDG
jgi:hypothetical protein